MANPINRARREVARLLTPEHAGTGAKVSRNVIYSGVRALLVWPLPFVVIPFVLAYVGLAGYGIWAVCLTLIKLTALADPGVGGAITKYVAQHDAIADEEGLSRLLNTGLLLYLLMASGIVIIFGSLSGILIPVLFRRCSGLSYELLFAWRWTLVISCINLLTAPFSSAILGLQRMDLSNALSGLSSVASAVLLFILLPAGCGLHGLFYAYAGASTLSLFGFIWSTHRLLPGIRFNPLRFKYAEARRIARFSAQIYVTGLATTISTEIEKLYLTWFTGIIAVGWYDMANQVALRVRRVPEMLLSPVMAAASELDARGEHRKLRELYYRAHKYVALVAVPLCFYIIMIAHRLVDSWIGAKLSVVAAPLAVLAAANLFNLISGPGLMTLVGKGILRPGLYSALLGIVLNLTLSFWLISHFGFSGAVIGTAAAVVIATVFFLVKFKSLMGAFSTRSVVGIYLKPIAISLALCMALAVTKPFGGLGSEGLILETLLFAVVYLACLACASFFDAFDLDKMQGHFPVTARIRRFIRIA